MAFIKVYLTGYPYTSCIHLMAYSLDSRSYKLCACCRYLLAYFLGLRGCHCPWSWVIGMRYLPRSCLLPMIMGFLYHVINTYSSLYTMTPSLVKMDTLASSAFLPTLIRYVGNSSNMYTSAALLESCGNGSVVTYLPLQALPLANPTFLADTRNFCPFRWGSVRLRLNRTSTFLYCPVYGMWRSQGSEVYMLTFICYYVVAMVGYSAECIPPVSSLADCWFF